MSFATVTYHSDGEHHNSLKTSRKHEQLSLAWTIKYSIVICSMQTQ